MSRRDREASAWFARMRGPDAETHRAAFDDWHRDPDNAAAHAEAEMDWLDVGGVSRAHVAAHGAARTAGRVAPMRWALASVGALSLALGVGWDLMPRTGEQQIALPSNGKSERILADGTRVRLFEGGQIDVRYAAGERQVVLLGGRARFDVAHDAARPFVVVAGRSETVALGTIFEVDFVNRAIPRVALIQGTVEVRGPASAAPLRLRPGETAEVPAAGPRIMTGPPELMQATMVEGNDIRLGEIVERANRVNAVTLRIDDPEVANITLSGRFDLRDGAALSRKLAATLNLETQTNGSEIIISARNKKEGE